MQLPHHCWSQSRTYRIFRKEEPTNRAKLYIIHTSTRINARRHSQTPLVRQINETTKWYSLFCLCVHVHTFHLYTNWHHRICAALFTLTDYYSLYTKQTTRNPHVVLVARWVQSGRKKVGKLPPNELRDYQFAKWMNATASRVAHIYGAPHTMLIPTGEL